MPPVMMPAANATAALMLRLLEEEEDREPYEAGDMLVGPALSSAMQVLGLNITNSSDATDVCCHLREAGLNTSSMWPWDCADIHLCAVEPGFQVPGWAQGLIIAFVVIAACVGATVWYIHWEYAKGQAVRQDQLDGVGLKAHKPKKPQKPKKQPKKKKEPKKKEPKKSPFQLPQLPDGAPPLRGAGRAAIGSLGQLGDKGIGQLGHLGDKIGDNALGGQMLAAGGQLGQLGGQGIGQLGKLSDQGSDQLGKLGGALRSSGAEEVSMGAAPEPDPEPEVVSPSDGWGKLEGWQYHPAKQTIFQQVAICIKIDAFCIKIDDFCTKMMVLMQTDRKL